jgi:hypothetical protein
MAKEPVKVSDEVIRTIEAQKAAVITAAQGYGLAKFAQDPTWEKTREGLSFIKSLEDADKPIAESTTPIRDFFSGDKNKPIYGRSTHTEFNEVIILNKKDRAVRTAQQALLAAQTALQKTMDSNFGTRSGRMANENRSLMEAVEGFTDKQYMLFGNERKSLADLGADLGKPLKSLGDNFSSILAGPGETLKIKEGDYLPSFEKKELPKKAFLTPNFLHNRQGVIGIVSSLGLPFTRDTSNDIFPSIAGSKGAARVIGIGFDAARVGFSIAGHTAGMAFDAGKMAINVGELGIRTARLAGNTAYAAVKGSLLGLTKAARGVALGAAALVSKNAALRAPTADFSLEAYGADKNRIAAATSSEATKNIDAAIGSNQEARLASRAAITTVLEKNGAQKAAVFAGRNAGRDSLKKQMMGNEAAQDRAIDGNTEAAKAKGNASKAVMDKEKGFLGRELYKNDPAGKEAAAEKAGRKAGLAVLISNPDQMLIEAAPVLSENEAAMGQVSPMREMQNKQPNVDENPESMNNFAKNYLENEERLEGQAEASRSKAQPQTTAPAAPPPQHQAVATHQGDNRHKSEQNARFDAQIADATAKAAAKAAADNLIQFDESAADEQLSKEFEHGTAGGYTTATTPADESFDVSDPFAGFDGAGGNSTDYTDAAPDIGGTTGGHATAAVGGDAAPATATTADAAAANLIDLDDAAPAATSTAPPAAPAVPPVSATVITPTPALPSEQPAGTTASGSFWEDAGLDSALTDTESVLSDEEGLLVAMPPMVDAATAKNAVADEAVSTDIHNETVREKTGEKAEQAATSQAKVDPDKENVAPDQGNSGSTAPS